MDDRRYLRVLNEGLSRVQCEPENWGDSLPAVAPATASTRYPRGIGESTMTSDDTTKRAAQYMLRKGLANPFEVAKLSKRSRQIVRIWVPEHSEARDEFLKQQWAKAVKWASKRA